LRFGCIVGSYGLRLYEAKSLAGELTALCLTRFVTASVELYPLSNVILDDINKLFMFNFREFVILNGIEMQLCNIVLTHFFVTRPFQFPQTSFL